MLYVDAVFATALNSCSIFCSVKVGTEVIFVTFVFFKVLLRAVEGLTSQF